MYDKDNCAECNFHGDFKHKEKKVYCYVHLGWRSQDNACKFWSEPTDMTKEQKIAMASLIRKAIENKKKEAREQQRHEQQLDHQNKLSWRHIIAGIFSGLIVGVIIGLLF